MRMLQQTVRCKVASSGSNTLRTGILLFTVSLVIDHWSLPAVTFLP